MLCRPTDNTRVIKKKMLYALCMIGAVFSCWAIARYVSSISPHAWQDCWPRPQSYNIIAYAVASAAALLSYMFGLYTGLLLLCSAIWWSILLFADEVRRYLPVLICLPIQCVLLICFGQLLQGNLIEPFRPFALVPSVIQRMYVQYCTTIPIWLLFGAIVVMFAILFIGGTVPFLRALKQALCQDRVFISDYSASITDECADVSELCALPANQNAQAGQEEICDPLSPVDMDDSVTAVHEDNSKHQESYYCLPRPATLFSAHAEPSAVVNGPPVASKQRAAVLEQKLARFGVTGSVVRIRSGPVVTLYEYEPAADVKVSKIIALENDLALALKARSLRIIAPIPGKNVVGFEVANQERHIVRFSAIAQSPAFQNSSHQLPLILGRNTVGSVVIADLAHSPHLLVAGSTGSGKSVCLNAMLSTLLLCKRPDECKFILIDPKRLEFMPYANIAHLLFPVITDAKVAVQALSWLTAEMERRYELLAQSQVRSIHDYNRKNKKKGDALLPYVVVVIDELADLMMVCGKEIEYWITRLTQMARAAGIHLLVATQRPSVDVITGLIKVNIPSRIAFQVTSKIDSRTILDVPGAERLLGKGDMLVQLGSNSSLQRVHGAYIEDSAIADLVGKVAAQAHPDYIDLSAIRSMCDDQSNDDELLPEVECFIDTVDEISVSLLQRKFRIGYNRSARLVEMLEQKGRITPPTGSKMRKVVK